MDIPVRFAQYEDLPAVNEIRRQVNTVHCQGRPDIFRPGFCEEMQNLLYEWFSSDQSDVIVALVEDKICGFAIVEYRTKPLSPYSLERHYYEVVEFGVDEEHRRKGIATALVAFMKKDVVKKGFPRMELDMWEFNEGALKFYENAGFQTYRRYMELPLAPAEEEKTSQNPME
ncbi:MAG: GNAT family N-acetyltransferase [Candidatus Heritagella sp.]